MNRNFFAVKNLQSMYLFQDQDSRRNVKQTSSVNFLALPYKNKKGRRHASQMCDFMDGRRH